MRTARISTPVSVCALLCFALVGCHSSASSSAAVSDNTTGSGGGGGGTTVLTAAALVSGGYNGDGGYQMACTSIGGANTYGSALSTYSILKYIYYFSNGTYSLTTGFISGSTCSGNEAFAYNQTGTFTVGAASSSPSGGYDIQYDATSAILTVYGQYFSGAWATAFNSASCAGGLGLTFSTTAASTSTTVSGLTCINGGAGLDIAMPANGFFYDVIVPSSISSPTSFYAYSNAPAVFQMGQFSSYPTTASLYYNN
jgi:hypothetical protein